MRRRNKLEDLIQRQMIPLPSVQTDDEWSGEENELRHRAYTTASADLISLFFINLSSPSADLMLAPFLGGQINSRIIGKYDRAPVSQLPGLPVLSGIPSDQSTTADNADENVDWRRSVQRASLVPRHGSKGVRGGSIEWPASEIDLA